MIEHHKADYEEEVAGLQADSPSGASNDEMSDDDSSSLFSIGQIERESEMTSPTEISLLDFDAEMEIVDLDDLLSSSDSETSLYSPPYVIFTFYSCLTLVKPLSLSSHQDYGKREGVGFNNVLREYIVQCYSCCSILDHCNVNSNLGRHCRHYFFFSLKGHP